jgi:chromosome segregation ATPase
MVLTALGVGGILLEVMRRYFTKVDTKTTGDSNYNIKLVDDRAVFTGDLLKRLDTVEHKYLELEAKLIEREKDYNVLFREHVEVKGKLDRLQEKFDELQIRYTDLRKKYVELKHRYESISGETFDDDDIEV